MQSWYALREIHSHARAQLRDALRTCDSRYLALSDNADFQDADRIDEALAEVESQVWKNIDAAGRSLVCLRSIVCHLRDGAPITDGEREPRLRDAVMLLRQARLSAAVDQTRCDSIAAEIAEAVAEGTTRLTLATAELKGLCLTADVARAHQRIQWLRRREQANPAEDLSERIREVEKLYAAAKLAFATHKGAKP